MNVFQQLRLMLHRGSEAVTRALSWLTSWFPGMSSTKVGNLKLIGAKDTVGYALDVLGHFGSASPELRAELDAKVAIIFLYVPPIEGTFPKARYLSPAERVFTGARPDSCSTWFGLRSC